MSYITCKDLAVGYDGRAVASGLNFSIDKGDYLCIVGENGAGKSTLVKTLLGLLKPVSGEIKFGDDLTSRDIGYLPQQTPVQKDFPATVWEVALSGTLPKCGARPFYGRKEKQLAQSQLERLGIWDIRRKCYRHLSLSEKQQPPRSNLSAVQFLPPHKLHYAAYSVLLYVAVVPGKDCQFQLTIYSKGFL